MVWVANEVVLSLVDVLLLVIGCVVGVLEVSMELAGCVKAVFLSAVVTVGDVAVLSVAWKVGV